MQINVAGYSDYLYRMAKINGQTVSKYVLSIIQNDFEDEKHQELYKALQCNNQFDYVRRESPNKGRGRNQLKTKSKGRSNK